VFENAGAVRYGGLPIDGDESAWGYIATILVLSCVVIALLVQNVQLMVARARHGDGVQNFDESIDDETGNSF
jgi:hypothetical protein